MNFFLDKLSEEINRVEKIEEKPVQESEKQDKGEAPKDSEEPKDPNRKNSQESSKKEDDKDGVSPLDKSFFPGDVSKDEEEKPADVSLTPIRDPVPKKEEVIDDGGTGGITTTVVPQKGDEGLDMRDDEDD